MPGTGTVRALSQAQLSGTAGAPEWVHLLPAGEALARDGRKFVLGNAEEVVTRFTQANVDLPIDYEHQADTHREDYTGPVPAAGWIKELAARADGLWGRVEWTGRAAQMIRDKEYRYLSPSLLFDKETKHVFRLKGAGLVHRPALHLTALASEEDDMDGQDFMQAVMDMLGMSEETDMETVLEALRAAIKGKSTAKPDPSKFVPIEAMEDLLRDRNARSATMSEQNAQSKVKDALDRGYITPAMRDWATALCVQDEASFDSFVSKSVPKFGHLLTPSRMSSPPPSSFSNSVRAESELASAVCAQLGLPADALN